MGFITTVVLHNDMLSSIENDLQFGPRVAAAMRSIWADYRPAEIGSVGFVIETHHNDGYVPVLVGRSQGIALEVSIEHGEDLELALLKRLAAKRGFRLVRKKKT